MRNGPFYLNPNLDFTVHCSVCKAGYGFGKGEVIEKKDNFLSVYLRCPKCESALVASILFGTIGGVVITAMLTDLKMEDIKKLKKASPISADDVIEIHKELEEINKSYGYKKS